MLRELAECIDARAFASLILDYEWEDMVSCRVLIEDRLAGRIRAKNRDEAIEKFRRHEW